MMTRVAGDIFDPRQAINIAEDHAINYSLKDLIVASSLANYWPEIEACGMYSKKYHEAQMSDIQILKDMVENDNLPTVKQVSDMLSQVGQDGITTNQPTEQQGAQEPAQGSKDKCSTASDDSDISASDLAEALQDVIRSNTKGTAVGDLFEDLFGSIKVETGWFKKIKASFKRQVYYMTHDYTTSWANLNNTYRRIYKAPKKQFIDDKVSIILSVDHSGSMATKDLQKLLYLVESESTRIGSITVLIHDTVVTKVFELESEFDIAASPDFKAALATRYTAGGTSHACVFEYIQNAKLEDPNKVIYLSFSDNYSDIEETLNNYPVMRKLTKYWVSPVHNPVRCAGTNINMV